MKATRLGLRIVTTAKSMGVGGLATLLDLGALYALTVLLHVSPRVASLPALTLGIAVQFFGQKLFAFENKSRRWAGQATRFLAVEALGFAANLLLFDWVVRRFPDHFVVVRLCTTNIVYFGICLPLWSRIFDNREGSAR